MSNAHFTWEGQGPGGGGGGCDLTGHTATGVFSEPITVDIPSYRGLTVIGSPVRVIENINAK